MARVSSARGLDSATAVRPVSPVLVPSLLFYPVSSVIVRSLHILQLYFYNLWQSQYKAKKNICNKEKQESPSIVWSKGPTATLVVAQWLSSFLANILTTSVHQCTRICFNKNKILWYCWFSNYICRQGHLQVLISNIDIFASHMDPNKLTWLVSVLLSWQETSLTNWSPWQECKYWRQWQDSHCTLVQESTVATQWYAGKCLHLSAAQSPAESDTAISVLHTGWK